MIKKTLITFLLSGFTLTSHAETHQFKLNLDEETYEIGIKLPKPKALGSLQLVNGISLPAYQVYFTAGYSDKDYETISPQTLKITKSLDKKLQNDLWLTHLMDVGYSYQKTGGLSMQPSGRMAVEISVLPHQ